MSKENTAVTKKKIKRCKEDVVFDAACFIILTLVLFVVAYPLYWVIISSISAPSAVSSGKVLLHPIGFTLKGYAEVFKNDQVMRGFLNSLIITFCGVMVNLIVTLPKETDHHFLPDHHVLRRRSDPYLSGYSETADAEHDLGTDSSRMLKRIQHDRGKNLLQVEHFGRAV